jgi:hypothetical protein
MKYEGAHFILRKLGLLSSSYDRQIVGLTQHLRDADASVEVCRKDTELACASLPRAEQRMANPGICAPLDTFSSHGSALKTVHAGPCQNCS